jgi:hypothetical protein
VTVETAERSSAIADGSTATKSIHRIAAGRSRHQRDRRTGGLFVKVERGLTAWVASSQPCEPEMPTAGEESGEEAAAGNERG